MLQLRDLNAYYGKSHVLQGVSLSVGSGEIVSLLGRNGVGRSTTVKAIMGEVRPYGEILFRGRNIEGLPSHRIARLGLGYVPESRDIFPTLTVRQNLMLGIKDTSKRGRWEISEVFDMFPDLGARADTAAGCYPAAKANADHLPHLDGGSRSHSDRRAYRRPRASGRSASWQPNRRDCCTGISILLVEQKLSIAMRISHRIYVMGHGKVVFDGTPASLRSNAHIRQQWLEV